MCLSLIFFVQAPIQCIDPNTEWTEIKTCTFISLVFIVLPFTAYEMRDNRASD